MRFNAPSTCGRLAPWWRACGGADCSGFACIVDRAGGAQDNSQGQLFIGGEYSNFSVGSGLNPPVFVTANQKIWTFETTGTFANPVMQYSDLPSPSTVGVRAFISDANVAATGNFGAIVSGGGSNNVPVFSDGTNWLVG